MVEVNKEGERGLNVVTRHWYLGSFGRNWFGNRSRRQQTSKGKRREECEVRRPIQANIRYLNAEWDDLKGLEFSQWLWRIK